MDKRSTYSQHQLVDVYEQRRFSGKSGEFVNWKELNSVHSLITRNLVGTRVILDSPCGTGRLSHFLKLNEINAIGLDYSMAMLNQTMHRTNIPLIRADMFQIPFKNLTFEGVISLRFMFHYVDIEPILQEMNRVLMKGGILIFDTFKWSPKANRLFKDKRVFIHTSKKIKTILRKIGLDVIDEIHCFLAPPVIYKMLPMSIVQFLSALEKKAPSRLLIRTFWCAKKNVR